MTRVAHSAKPSTYDLSDEEIARLAELAVEAKSKAYCPYSRFPVGAALLLSSGTYHTGANVEIASSPVGICAERCALAPVIASFTRSQHYTQPQSEGDDDDINLPTIRGLAVSTNIDPPASPCGMCRQFIKEFCGADMKIWMYGGRWDRGERDGEEEKRGEESGTEQGHDERTEEVEGTSKGKVVEVRTIGELLPMSFSRRDLQR